MCNRQPAPGISRTDRLSPAGLERLDRQLVNGSQISDGVLAQWIRRYGELARVLIKQHGRYHAGLESGGMPPGKR